VERPLSLKIKIQNVPAFSTLLFNVYPKVFIAIILPAQLMSDSCPV